MLIAAVMAALPAALPVRALQFTIDRYTIEGPNPIGQSAADTVLAPFRGELDGLDGLQRAVQALQQAFNERGFTFYRVVLPPQTLDSGTVRLEVVAMQLAEVSVSGNQRFDDANVKRALPFIRPGEVPHPYAMSNALDFANLHIARRVNVKLAENKSKQALNAIITVEEQRPWKLFAGINNIGSEDTGRNRITFGAVHGNLLNRDHLASLNYTTSPENADDVFQFAASYEIPLYWQRATLSAFYSKSDVDVGQVGDFAVSGAGNFWGVVYTQHLTKVGGYAHSWSLGMEGRLFENDVDFAGQQLGIDVRSVPLTASYAGNIEGEGWNASFGLSYSRNLGIYDRNDDLTYSLTRSGADAGWDAVRFNGLYQRKLPADLTGRIVVDGQWSNDALIPGEQWGLGGWQSVRGLDERALTGDSGIRASFELYSPPDLLPAGLRVLGFFDVGAWDREAPLPGETASDSVASVGLGARWAWNNALSVSMDYGKTIVSSRGVAPGSPDIDDTKLHFNVFYTY
ncbi:MAG: ShlB/FhaC/HecB family hemolysin secretion/activation protein [Gammaproteobacteria bacterium]|nr:ShlB/FhaC/HecB family hemolysin secretion/activation protein [Gammaproteobacteria bacterium]